MKIIVKQEADTTCVWVVGEDGETLPYSETNPTEGEGTAYLKDGQQVQVDVEIAAKATGDGQDNFPKATMGDVTAIAGAETPTPEPDEDQKQGQRPDEAPSEDDQPGGANDTSVLR